MTGLPRVGLALLGGLAMVVVTVKSARADDAACFAASEAEIALKQEGKIRDAIKQLALCAAPSCPTEVSTECGRRLLALNAALPTVVLSATDAAGNDVAAVTITLDGAPFAASLDGAALPIDPGSHTLHFAPATGAPLDKTVIIREGEKDRRISVTLGAAIPGATPGAGPASATPSPGSIPPASPSSWSTQKTLALVSGGVGVVGIGLGSVFGAMALSDASTTKSDCPSSSCSPSAHANAVSEHSSASSAGTVSTAMFIVGGLGLAGGAVLWFTAPKGEKSPPASALRVGPIQLDPAFGPGGGAVMLSGRFQ